MSRSATRLGDAGGRHGGCAQPRLPPVRETAQARGSKGLTATEAISWHTLRDSRRLVEPLPFGSVMATWSVSVAVHPATPSTASAVSVTPTRPPSGASW